MLKCAGCGDEEQVVAEGESLCSTCKLQVGEISWEEEPDGN